MLYYSSIPCCSTGFDSLHYTVVSYYPVVLGIIMANIRSTYLVPSPMNPLYFFVASPHLQGSPAMTNSKTSASSVRFTCKVVVSFVEGKNLFKFFAQYL